MGGGELGPSSPCRSFPQKPTEEPRSTLPSLVSLVFLLPSLVSLVFMLFYLLLLPFSCPHTLSVSVQRVVPAQGGAVQALRQSTAHHGHDVIAGLRSCAMFNDSMSVPLKSFWKRSLLHL